MLMLGISGPRTTETRNLVRTLVRCLPSAAHYSMQYPALAAAASILDIPVEHLQAHTPGHHPVPGTHITVDELISMQRSQLRILNPDFFIERAQQKLTNINKHLKQPIFTGYVFSDITCEREADWVRRKGGEIIHITNQHTPRDYKALENKLGEISLLTSAKDPATAEVLSGIVDHLNDKYHRDTITHGEAA